MSQWLRMLFKGKIKVYVEIDAYQMPKINDDGLVRYRYQLKPDATDYTTTRKALTMIPGSQTIEFDPGQPAPPKKDPKPRHVPVTQVKPVSIPDGILPPNTIVAYTDGGASPNPGPAGCGVLLMYGENSLEIWEYLGKSTNNIAELRAIQIVLENIKNPNLPVLIYSDSKYAIGVLSGQMKATKNTELIAEIRHQMTQFPSLHLLKVKAHIGIQHNEHVDRLVALARDTKQSGSRRS